MEVTGAYLDAMMTKLSLCGVALNEGLHGKKDSRESSFPKAGIDKGVQHGVISLCRTPLSHRRYSFGHPPLPAPYRFRQVQAVLLHHFHYERKAVEAGAELKIPLRIDMLPGRIEEMIAAFFP